MTVSGFTWAPGRSTMSSTRPEVVAGIQRISSGTSVPEPRTWRSISPRLTVSIHTVARSTDGAAGLSRDTATVMRMMTASADTPMMARRIFFLRMTDSGRAISTMSCLCPEAAVKMGHPRVQSR